MRPAGLFSLLVMLATIGSAGALDPILVGSPGVPFDGLTIPFGNDQYPSYQQLYDQSLFSNPILIGGLTFFDQNDPINSTIAAANYTIRLGTVPAGTILGNGLDANLASSADLSYFFQGQLSGQVPDQFTIVGQTP